MNGPGISRLRMNSIFPANNNAVSNDPYQLGPPDLNGGMDMMGMLQQILPVIQSLKPDRSAYNGMDPDNFFNLEEKKRQFNLTNKLKNEGLDVKKGDINFDNQLGRDKLNSTVSSQFANLFEKQREFQGKQDLGREGLNVKREGLDVKREGLDNSKNIANDKLDLQKDLGQQKVDIAKQRADIYKFKAEHPNVQIIRTKGGNVMIYDPADRTTHDTGIDSGTLSDEDEIKLRGKEARLTGDNASENRLGEIAARLAGQKELRDTKPVSASDITTTQNTKARELLAKYPSLANHLTQDAKGNYVSTAPEGSAASKLINDALYRPTGFGQDVNLPVEKSTVKPTKILKKDDDPLGLFKKGGK